MSADRAVKRGQQSINMSKRLSVSSEKQPIVISDDEFNDRNKNSALPKTLTKSTRKLRKKKVPYTAISFKKKEEEKDEYCICQSIYTDGGRMIECQNCQKWYHFSCLSLPTLSNETTGKHIQFKCGRLSCNYGVFMYKA